jgi:hypothetical protein
VARAHVCVCGRVACLRVCMRMYTRLKLGYLGVHNTLNEAVSTVYDDFELHYLIDRPGQSYLLNIIMPCQVFANFLSIACH